MDLKPEMPGAVPRRGLLRRAFAVPAALLIAAVGGIVGWRLTNPLPASGGFGGEVHAGRPDDYRVGDVRYWPDGRFYVVRLEAGFLALYQRCPHMDCPIPPPQRGAFECKCHFSRFTLRGERVVGPAERAMDLFPMRLQDGELVVRTGEPHAIRRDRFDSSQLLIV